MDGGERVLNQEEILALFGKEEWLGEPIKVLTRVRLARELGVSVRTLRRWESLGILNKPINSLVGVGRGNFAIYKDPLEGVVSVLEKTDGLYIRYVGGRVRWRKRLVRNNNEENYGLV